MAELVKKPVLLTVATSCSATLNSYAKKLNPLPRTDQFIHDKTPAERAVLPPAANRYTERRFYVPGIPALAGF